MRLNFDEAEDLFQVFIHAGKARTGRTQQRRVAVLSHLRSMAIGVRTSRLKIAPIDLANAVRVWDSGMLNNADVVVAA